MRAISGGSGHTSLLVSISGFWGCCAWSFLFLSLLACAVGLSESAIAARTIHKVQVSGLRVELFMANITAPLQSFLCGKCCRTAFPVSCLWPAGRVQRRHAVGGR